jgi:hypothetical protein
LVARAVARYHYSANWETALAGLSPARTSTKLRCTSWPKAIQEQFWSEGNHRAEAAGSTNWETFSFNDATDAVPLHLVEFLNCVRSRQQCSENAEVGQYVAAAGHMVNLSYRAGKKMIWDPETGTAGCG